MKIIVVKFHLSRYDITKSDNDCNHYRTLK